MNEYYDVTVVCLTYNHENYIKDALESFIRQKTNFKYRILVHDDASTDNTASIIREYEERYPELIQTVYQNENLYSKGGHLITKYIAKLLRTKYVAMCEGDDYWVDDYKLQKQYDAMEKNPNCKLCLHKVQRVNSKGEELGISYPSYVLKTGVLNHEFFMNTNVEYSFQTSCYFCTAKDWVDFCVTPPEFGEIFQVGDTPLMLYLGLKGDVYYIEDTMSCYRQCEGASWVQIYWSPKNEERYIASNQTMVDAFKSFDNYSLGKYPELVERRIALHLFIIYILQKTSYKYFTKDNFKYFKRLTFKRKLIVFGACIIPNTMKKMLKNRNRGGR